MYKRQHPLDPALKASMWYLRLLCRNPGSYLAKKRNDYILKHHTGIKPMSLIWEPLCHSNQIICCLYEPVWDPILFCLPGCFACWGQSHRLGPTTAAYIHDIWYTGTIHNQRAHIYCKGGDRWGKLVCFDVPFRLRFSCSGCWSEIKLEWYVQIVFVVCAVPTWFINTSSELLQNCWTHCVCDPDHCCGLRGAVTDNLLV